MSDRDDALDVSTKVYDETIFESPHLLDATRVVLHAERLVPDVRPIRTELAVLSRRVVTVRKTIEVDLSHEELVVEYRAGDRTRMDGTEATTRTFELHAEEIVVSKRVRVVEEVTVGTKRVAETQRFEAVVRREELYAVNDE